jgi:hypothetical protein
MEDTEEITAKKEGKEGGKEGMEWKEGMEGYLRMCRRPRSAAEGTLAPCLEGRKEGGLNRWTKERLWLPSLLTVPFGKKGYRWIERKGYDAWRTSHFFG